GGATNFQAFNAPFIEISKGCGMASVRNNVFSGACVTNPIKPLVNRKDEKDSEPRIGYADYNCFFNPQSPKAELYASGIVESKDAGAHDIKGDPGFAQGPSAQVLIDIGEAWAGKLKVSQILAQYRERYAPSATSPLASKGDPADGKESFIGAIGQKGCTRADDCFGKFGGTDEKSGSKREK
ncbi:MAG: hypothetical protein HY291_20680, partial [Planctomycetes bacterium]|nr:hypothetical protein [Planctomycetota bacterium]